MPCQSGKWKQQSPKPNYSVSTFFLSFLSLSLCCFWDLMNFYGIHEFIIRPPEALSCSVGGTAFFSFFLFPPLLRSFLRAWCINLIITHALYKKKTPFLLPIFYVFGGVVFYTHCLPALCCASILVLFAKCGIVSLYKCVFCVGIWVKGSVCVFFFFFGRFPPNFFGIYVVYISMSRRGFAPVLTSFELLHGTLPFLFKSPFF